MKKSVLFILAVMAIFSGCFFISCETTEAAAETVSSEISVPAATKTAYILNASEMALSSDIANGMRAGTDDFFTMNVPNPTESKLVVDANSKTVEGVAYSQRLKLGGVLNTVSFTVPSDASVKVVCCSSSSSSVRSLEFKAENTVITTVQAPGSPIQNTVEIPAGSYTLQAAGGGGVNIYVVEVILK